MTKRANVSRLGVAVSAGLLLTPMIAGFGRAEAAVGAAGISTTETAIDFGPSRVGVDISFTSVLITNTGPAAITIPVAGLAVSGPQAQAFFPVTGNIVSGASAASKGVASGAVTPVVVPSCYDSITGAPTPVPAGGECAVSVLFLPSMFGPAQATLTVTASDASTFTVALSGTGSGGYYLAGANGETLGLGDAPPGSTDPRSKAMSAPVKGIASTIDGNGNWTVASDGTVYSEGDAVPQGDLAGRALNGPVVALASDPRPTPTTTSTTTGPTLTLAPSSGVRGAYWLAGADGGVFAFGAPYFGSEGGAPLNQPIVGMSSTRDGGGYWLVAADGGVFAFGDARYFGSEGGARLNQPIVGMAATPDGAGYWLVAADGGVFAFGDAAFSGSEGGAPLNQPIVGMASTPDGGGYWLVAADGGVFGLGDSAFFGSLPGVTGGVWHSNDVVGMATTTQSLFTSLLGSLQVNAAGTRIVTNPSALHGRLRPVSASHS